MTTLPEIRYAILDKNRQVLDGDTYAAKAELFRNMSVMRCKYYSDASVWMLNFTSGTLTDVTAKMVREWWDATGSTDAYNDKMDEGGGLLFADARFFRTPAAALDGVA